MNFNYFLGIIFFIATQSFSQEKQKILFTIDKEPHYTQEFMRVYMKNKNIIADSNASIVSYLELFVAYKLKVKEARDLKLDTLQKFKTELKKYKEMLLLPYLKDEKVTTKLVEEAYYRLKKEINVSHILILLDGNALPKDTVTAYTKINKVRNLVLSGQHFSEVAKKYSEDPSAKQNGGSLGYFTALQMVYKFENVAFNTKVNEISKPFRTKFGYHILKVHNKRNARGEVEVAHIMLKNNGKFSENKIDSIYNVLTVNKLNFSNLAKNVSEDRASAIRGGKLDVFGTGKMIEDFANVAFSLKTKGEISKPFKTKFGWHIVTLLKKHPIKSFENSKEELTKKVENDARSNLISKSIIQKLFKNYKIAVNRVALNQFNSDNWKTSPEKFQEILLTIENKKIPQSTFIAYLKTQNNKQIKQAFSNFKEQEVLAYYKKNIEYSNAEFAVIYNEFKEGLLLFELLEKKVWEKSKDSIGLLNYFNQNKAKHYANKKLKNIKGMVISDYQKYLEKMWVKQLYVKYKVKFNKTERKKIKKLNLH